MLFPNSFPLSSIVIAGCRKRSRQEVGIIFRGLKCFSNFQMSVKYSNFVFIMRITQNINYWLEILIMVAPNGRVQMLVTDDSSGLLLNLLSGGEGRIPNIYLISWQKDGYYDAELEESV